MLQSMPRTNARSKGSAAFASAVRSAVEANCPRRTGGGPASSASRAMPREPARLPIHTQRPNAHHPRGLQSATCPGHDHQYIAGEEEMLPPPISTRLSPRAKTSPATTRAIPDSSTPSAPVSATVAKKIAPNAMKPPPRTPRLSSVMASCPALAIPSPSAFSAISGGKRPSMPAKARGC